MKSLSFWIIYIIIEEIYVKIIYENFIDSNIKYI